MSNYISPNDLKLKKLQTKTKSFIFYLELTEKCQIKHSIQTYKKKKNTAFELKFG